MLDYFRIKETVQENDILKALESKVPSKLQNLKSLFKEDQRKNVPRKFFELVLEQCLELRNLREVVKLVGQYKDAIQSGIDEEEDKNLSSNIIQAKAKLIKENAQLFEKFQLKPKLEELVVKQELSPQQISQEVDRQLNQLGQTKKAMKKLSGLIDKALDQQQIQEWLPKIEKQIPKEMKNTLILLKKYLDLNQTFSHIVIEQPPLPPQNQVELSGQFAQLNQTRQGISLFSQLIGKALNNQKLHDQLPKIEKIIPKEMQNMLTLLKTHLSLKQSLEGEFLKKLKTIDQSLIPEKEGLAPFEDNHDDNQINHLYQKISTFLEKNKASLENLRIFNQEIVDCLRSFVLQILQPLQKRKKEEIDLINILTNTGDVKNELQRVLASYKDYIQVNDQNSQEMEVRLREYSAEDEESKKKLKSLVEENRQKEEKIQKLAKQIKEEKTKLAEVEKKLDQMTQAHGETCRNNEIVNTSNQQLKQQNKTLNGKLITIRNKVTNLSIQMKKVQSAHPGLVKDVEAKIVQLKEYATKMDSMKELINSLNKSMGKIQDLTSKLADSQENQSRLQMTYEKSSTELSLTAQQLVKARDSIKDNELKLQETERSRERERDEYEKRIKDFENQIKELSLKIQSMNKTSSSLQADINEMRKRQADVLKENQELIKKISNQRDYQRYFAHEVLYDNSFYKKPIIEALEKRNYINVKATRLLFKFDPQNKLNFHRYIDGIPHILVIIKLENGRILACYTNQPFKPQNTGDDAFIMVLNTGNIYELKKGAKAISYDEYYLLFGNSEIRLRSGESLFSNFGIANSHFDNKGQSVDALFGEGKDKRELPIAGYEIYQIIFEEER